MTQRDVRRADSLTAALVSRRRSGGLAHEYKLGGCQVTSTLCD